MKFVGIEKKEQGKFITRYDVQYETVDGIVKNYEMIEKIKQESRRYAKRQLTWFRKNKQTIWIDGLANLEDNINIIEKELNK